MLCLHVELVSVNLTQLKLYISREKHVSVPFFKDAALHLYDDGELIQ